MVRESSVPHSSARRGTDLSDDISAYDLILRDKERLLSFDEPTRDQATLAIWPCVAHAKNHLSELIDRAREAARAPHSVAATTASAGVIFISRTARAIMNGIDDE